MSETLALDSNEAATVIEGLLDAARHYDAVGESAEAATAREEADAIKSCLDAFEKARLPLDADAALTLRAHLSRAAMEGHDVLGARSQLR